MTEEQNSESLPIEVASADVVYSQDRAAIDVMIATAKQYPRNITKATNNAIAVVTMDKETAATCTYSVPRGGKTITGPSVHMAKILAQQFGNMRIQAKVINIDQKQVTSEAVCFDLETNLAVKVEVKRSIVDRGGKRFSDDLVTVTGNAANAIAMRNAIYAVIPRAVVDKVYKAAKQTITGDISDANKLIAERKKVISKLRDVYNVTDDEICGAIGKAAVEQINGDDLVVLIGIGQAIADGDTTVEDAFRSNKRKSKEEHEKDRLEAMIKNAKTPEALDKLKKSLPKESLPLFEELTKEK